MPTLNWIGKEAVVKHHKEVPFRLLEPVPELSCGDSASGNLIVQGDNLHALKALLPRYAGQVKCIYIDPPYNTGNEGWVYNDNVNDPKIKKWLGQVVGKESEDLTRHDKWLCMMYPRLKLLKKLLAEDGSMVISIGYHEVFNLMPLLNELFSTKQLSCVTVQTSGGKPSGSFNYQHEFLIFILPAEFEPNPMNFTGGKERTPFEGLTLATFDKTQRPNQTYPIFINLETSTLHSVGESLQERKKNGTYNNDLSEFEYNFSEAPEGTVAIWPITSKGKQCVWRLTSNRLLNDWEKGYIKITPNRQKDSLNKFSIQYLPEGVIKKIEKGELKVSGKEATSPTLTFGENKTVGSEIPTIWLEKEFFSVKGTTLLNDIFSKKVFNYPKPLALITEILRALTSQNDIILDSFAGSGSTGHATLDLNKLDDGAREFILIEMEDYAETVTAERIKMVINGFADIEGTGGSFDYYTLGAPMFTDQGHLNEQAGAAKIRAYVYYTETKQRLTPGPSPEERGEENVHFLGKHHDTAYYFYYEPERITSLDHAFLATIKTRAEQYVIYADNCLLTQEYLTGRHIIFKKIPRDISRF
ncbi:MAG TPA: site-specific DNA-methyltransferase [Saprospirales bacterium]|nr:site-specific DNA-methyltransferase [Saprospirales bacterium]